MLNKTPKTIVNVAAGLAVAAILATPSASIAGNVARDLTGAIYGTVGGKRGGTA